MKQLLFILFLFPALSFAAKTYQYEIIVLSKENKKAIKGLEVVLTSEKEKAQTQFTNEEGKVVFTIKKGTHYSITVLGESMLYNNWTSKLYRKKGVELQETVILTPPPTEFVAQCEEIVDAFFANEGKDLLIDTTYKCQGESLMAEFPGGMEKMSYFFSTYLIYPPDAQEMGCEGKVYMRFEIDYSGAVQNIQILRGVQGCPSMEQEAQRIIGLMPRWIPERCGNYLQKVVITLPIGFALN